jgi:hypothetical protein
MNKKVSRSMDLQMDHDSGITMIESAGAVVHAPDLLRHYAGIIPNSECLGGRESLLIWQKHRISERFSSKLSM